MPRSTLIRAISVQSDSCLWDVIRSFWPVSCRFICTSWISASSRWLYCISSGMRMSGANLAAALQTAFACCPTHASAFFPAHSYDSCCVVVHSWIKRYLVWVHEVRSLSCRNWHDFVSPYPGAGRSSYVVNWGWKCPPQFFQILFVRLVQIWWVLRGWFAPGRRYTPDPNYLPRARHVCPPTFFWLGDTPDYRSDRISPLSDFR